MDEDWIDVKWICDIKRYNSNFLPDDMDYEDYTVHSSENKYDE